MSLPASFNFPLIGRAAPWLAPLAGHTDLALRVLCREQGAAVACSEMVSAKGLVYAQRRGQRGIRNGEWSAAPGGRKPDNGSAALLLTLPGSSLQSVFTPEYFPASATADEPLVIQLFGDDPELLGQAVELLRGWGYDWFDLNLGCSVPKVLKTGAGAALARDTEKTLRAAEAMIRAAGALPPVNTSDAPEQTTGARLARGRVGFKLRLGWSASEENYLDLAKGLEQCGAGWLTLHPRHARQGFAGSADWSALAGLRRAVSLPLMASGDLLDAASALRCLEESGVTGLMFARGALHNPAIFSEYLGLVQSGSGTEKTESFFSAGKRLELEPALDVLTPLSGGRSGLESVLERGLDMDALKARAAALKRLILRHAELARAMPEKQPHGRRGRSGQARPEGSLLKMRGAIPRYVRELPGSRTFRVEISLCESWDSFFAALEKFFQSFEF